MMKHFDAFAGIGGFTRAFKNIFGIDYQNVGFSEINKYAAACYQYHFPNHNLKDQHEKLIKFLYGVMKNRLWK